MRNFGVEKEEDAFYRYLPRAENLTFKREFIAFPLLVLILIGLVIGLFILGVVQYPYYQAQAARNRIARIVLSPPRGEILDRKGSPLAVNHAAYNCYFISSDNLENDLEDIRRLGEFLGLGPDSLESVLQSRRETASQRSMISELWAVGRGVFGARSILVKRDLNQVEVTGILERRTDFPSTFLERSYRRSYPAGESSAQVIGYVGLISETELDEWSPLGYGLNDMIGKAGLERYYDNYLRGRSGERLVAVDARGRILGDAEMVPAVVPENGAVLVRGDEAAVLHDGESADFTGGSRASMLNGVLTVTERRMADVSGRDRMIQPMVFEDTGRGGSYGDWQVFRTPGEVARHEERIVMRPSVVPPAGGAPLRLTLDLDMQREIDEILGSHVGGVVAMNPEDGAILALVSEPGYDPNLFGPGGVDPEGWQTILDDEDHPLLNRPVQNAYVPGSTFKIVTALTAAENGFTGSSWTCHGSVEVGGTTFRCWNRGGHGPVNFTEAIAQSCDVAFWEMAQDMGQSEIFNVSHTFGLGAPLGIDLPDERSGLVPDDAWKRERIGERWYTGDTMNMAIGQGFVQLTMLQVARTTAVIANNGFLVTPYLNRFLKPAPSLVERIDVDSASINAVRRGLRACIQYGTGRGCDLDWIDLAGKTGTAEDHPRPEPHSWFTSYGPYDNPSLVIVVLCENGAYQDETAVPISRRIWECASVRAYLAEQE